MLAGSRRTTLLFSLARAHAVALSSAACNPAADRSLVAQ
jgi:hypothetical protein